VNKYPNGAIDETDEGEIKLAIYTKRNTVVIDFGKDLSWFAMTKAELEPFIELLQSKLEQL
jgi:hypothetical protein